MKFMEAHDCMIRPELAFYQMLLNDLQNHYKILIQVFSTCVKHCVSANQSPNQMVGRSVKKKRNKYLFLRFLKA